MQTPQFFSSDRGMKEISKRWNKLIKPITFFQFLTDAPADTLRPLPCKFAGRGFLDRITGFSGLTEKLIILIYLNNFKM